MKFHTQVLSVLAFGLLACGDTPPATSERGTPGGRGGPSSPSAATPPRTTAPGTHTTTTASVADGGVSKPPTIAVQESDITENDRTRDPFRSFVEQFKPVGLESPIDEHRIKLREYSVEELRLIAVISGSDSPYGMVLDPTGRSTVLRRGDYVGKPEPSRAPGEGGLVYEIPWRVARIVGSSVHRDANNNLEETPGRIVFEREDRFNPLNHTERVLSLTQPQNAPSATSIAQPNVPLIPGLPGGVVPPLPAGTQPGQTVVQSYTTVLPSQPAQPSQPTTVIIQQQPPASSGTAGSSGGSNPVLQNSGSGVAPVMINNGPTFSQPPLPSSGLPR